MSAPLDIDQLHTFVAIVDTGSFTRAAGQVHKTQSAVSMQMRRLEERLGKQLFVKDGRTNRLTEEGDRLLGYARRMIRLNNETVAAFDENSLEGSIRIGTPDDYADRYMPDIIARFAKSNPNVELFIDCEPSADLAEKLGRGELDIALVTHNPRERVSEVVRTEPLCWVTSTNHHAHENTPVPLAVGRRNCTWRRLACSALDTVGRDYQILFTSWSATVVASAVLAGHGRLATAGIGRAAGHAHPFTGRRLSGARSDPDWHHEAARNVRIADERRDGAHRRQPRQHHPRGHLSERGSGRQCHLHADARPLPPRSGDGGVVTEVGAAGRRSPPRRAPA